MDLEMMLFTHYDICRSEYQMLAGYAEGHNLELRFENDEVRLIDLQDETSSWGDGILSVVEKITYLNEDLIEQYDGDNKTYLMDLYHDNIVLNDMHRRIEMFENMKLGVRCNG